MSLLLELIRLTDPPPMCSAGIHREFEHVGASIARAQRNLFVRQSDGVRPQTHQLSCNPTIKVPAVDMRRPQRNGAQRRRTKKAPPKFAISGGTHDFSFDRSANQHTDPSEHWLL